MSRREALRAHYQAERDAKGFPRRIFIARVDGGLGLQYGADPYNNAAAVVAGQIHFMRSDRHIGGEETTPLGLHLTPKISEGRRAYLANLSAELHLNDALGYIVVSTVRAEPATITVTEGGVREVVACDRARHQRVTAAMLRPLLEDFMPLPGDPESLGGMTLSIASASPSTHGQAVMQSLHLSYDRELQCFVGSALQAYGAAVPAGMRQYPIAAN